MFNIPLITWMAELFVQSSLYHAISNELWQSPLFWLVTFYISVTVSLPFYIARNYKAHYMEPDIYG